MNRLTIWMTATMVVCVLVFTVWPELDLAVSRVFYDPARGFSGDYNPLVQSLYRGIPLMSKATIIGLFIALFAYSMQRGATGRKRRTQVAYLIAALILGPGLVIDVALKDYWGRARPYKVAEFGGAKSFTPATQPSDQCENNCSFVSGHASAGYYLVSLGFLGGIAARRRWTLIGLVVGTVFGFGRIAQGGHFLSDIVFSFYATWFAAWAAWMIFLRLGWLQDDASIVDADQTAAQDGQRDTAA